MRPFGPISLGTLSAQGIVASSGAQVAAAAKLSIQVFGTFSATYNVEGTLDGTNWAPLLTGATTAQIVTVVTPILQVRVNCTAWTSGSLGCVYRGFESMEAR